MAKFKVGDKVRWGNSGLCTVSDIKKTIRGYMYELKLPDGGTFYPVDEQSLADAVRRYGTNSCTSTNPVVQNAIEKKTTACNSVPGADSAGKMLFMAQDYVSKAKKIIQGLDAEDAREFFYEADGLWKEIEDFRRRVLNMD